MEGGIRAGDGAVAHEPDRWEHPQLWPEEAGQTRGWGSPMAGVAGEVGGAPWRLRCQAEELEELLRTRRQGVVGMGLPRVRHLQQQGTGLTYRGMCFLL